MSPNRRDDEAGLVAVTFTIPPSCVGFLGSPREFDRAERVAQAGSFTSAQVLLVGDGRRELRIFELPSAVTLHEKHRVPGFNIQILTAGTQLMVQVARSALTPSDIQEESS